MIDPGFCRLEAIAAGQSPKALPSSAKNDGIWSFGSAADEGCWPESDGVEAGEVTSAADDRCWPGSDGVDAGDTRSGTDKRLCWPSPDSAEATSGIITRAA